MAAATKQIRVSIPYELEQAILLAMSKEKNPDLRRLGPFVRNTLERKVARELEEVRSR